MSRFALVVALLLFATGVSGCLGGSDDSAAPMETPPQGGASAVPSEEVAVDDGTSEEAGRDLGHQPHIHDYWMGKERVVLMDEVIEVDAPTAFAFTFFNVFRGTPGVGGTFVRLPEGAIVYEGTGRLEFTAAWTDATVTGVGLRYRSAASPDFTPAQRLSQASPLAIDVLPVMADMPHEKTSRWNFLLVPAEAGQAIVGKVHVRVEIVRVGDLSTFPGHPELFFGQHTLTLFDGPGKTTQSNLATQIIGFMTGAPDDDSVASEKVVPMETASMTANVTVTSSSATLGSVSEIQFYFKPADSNGYRRAKLVASDESARTYSFAFPVDMRQTDSPYAETSQWRFLVRATSDPTGTGSSCGGCGDITVDYQLQVVAYDGLVDGAEVVQGRGG